MTTVAVPMIPPVASVSEITTGTPVLGSTWRAQQNTINYLTAKGGQLVVANQPNLTITAGSSHTLRYYVYPRAIHARRVWVISVSSVGARSAVAVQDGATAQASYFVSLASTATGGNWNTLGDQPPPLIYIGEYTRTSTPGEISIVIGATTVDAIVYRVACFEMPRARLELGESENAALFNGSGFGIYETAESGIYGIGQAVDAGRTKHRRANFHWWDYTGVSNATTSFVDLFALPPKVLARAGSTVDGTTKTVAWAAYVATTGGDAEVKVTAASGDTDTITANGAAAWYTGTIAIDREDLTDADTGGQSGRALGDSLTFASKCVAPTTNVKVQGLAVSEAL